MPIVRARIHPFLFFVFLFVSDTAYYVRPHDVLSHSDQHHQHHHHRHSITATSAFWQATLLLTTYQLTPTSSPPPPPQPRWRPIERGALWSSSLCCDSNVQRHHLDNVDAGAADLLRRWSGSVFWNVGQRPGFGAGRSLSERLHLFVTDSGKLLFVYIVCGL